MLSLSKTRRTREQFSPRCPVHPGRVPWAAEMRYPMEAPGRGCGRELDPIGQHRTSDGRLAQRESASFTPRRSLVRSQYRPPGQRLCESLYQAYDGSHSVAAVSEPQRAIVFISLWIRATTVDQDERGNAERRALFIGLW